VVTGDGGFRISGERYRIRTGRVLGPQFDTIGAVRNYVCYIAGLSADVLGIYGLEIVELFAIVCDSIVV
jgi:hypothetical protein